MNELLDDLIYVRVYFYYLLIICNGNFEDHLNTIKIVLTKLKAAGFKVNAKKLFFARDNLEYLGYKISRQGVMTLPDEV